MNDQRTLDRFWGVLLGIPVVAIPVRLAEWSPVVGAFAALVFAVMGLGFIFNILKNAVPSKVRANDG